MREHAIEVREQGKLPFRFVVTTSVEVGRQCPGVNLADPGVSRRHLLLAASPEGLTATDLGSLNGTTVNGVRIARATTVKPGDVIRMHHTELLVLEPSAEVPEAPPEAPAPATQPPAEPAAPPEPPTGVVAAPPPPPPPPGPPPPPEPPEPPPRIV